MPQLASCHKIAPLLCMIIFSTTQVNAQEGLFAKISIGSGYTTEYSNINGTAKSIVTKNHTIGWGITDDFAVQIGEFGGLNKKTVGEFDYINLDAVGLGFVYRAPIGIKISALGGYAKVSFAKEWTESFGEDGGDGYGINMSIDKEWFIAKKWGARIGPQFYWLKTTETDYKFYNVSVNASLVFYLKGVIL